MKQYMRRLAKERDALGEGLLTLLIVGFPLAYALQELVGATSGVVTVSERALNLLAACAVMIFRRPRLSARSWSIILALVLFAALFSVTMFLRLVVDGENSLTPPSVLFGLFWGIGIIPAIAVLWARLGRQSNDVRLLGILLAGNTIFLIMTILEGRELLHTQFGRFRTESGINQIYLGHMAVMNVYLAAVWHSRMDKWRLPKLTLLTALFAISAGVFGMVAAASRGPIISLFAVFLLWALPNANRLLGAAAISLAAVVAYVLLSVLDPLALFNLTGSSLFVRLAETYDYQHELRWEMLQIAFARFLASPLFGGELLVWGTYPHNYLVEILMATGLAGMALFLAVFVPAWRACLTAAMRRRLTFFHLLFCHMSFAFLFSGSVADMHMLWTSMAVVLSIGAASAGQATPWRRVSKPARLPGALSEGEGVVIRGGASWGGR